MYKGKKNVPREDLSNMKGITLIALVITIIVLLILAGVTLASVTGDYGLFGKAGEAAGAYDRESVRERVQLEVMGSYNEKGKLDRTELQENIEKHLKVKHEDIENTEDGEMKFPMGDHNVTIDKDGFVWVDEEPETSPSTEPSQEPEVSGFDPVGEATGNREDIGKVVTNYTQGGYEWKLYYQDSKHAYLITSDLVDPSKVPGKGNSSMTVSTNTNYPKAAYWNTAMLGEYDGSTNITDTRFQSYNSAYFNYLKTNSKTLGLNNIKAVAYMYDHEIWEGSSLNLYNSTYADYVIGGPSLEMALRSYNYSQQLSFSWEVSSDNGYKLTDSTGSNMNRSQSGAFSKDVSNGVYVIGNSSSDTTKSAAGAWLASPSAFGADYLMRVRWDGDVGYHYYYNSAFGFRPLVCLKSNFKLVANGSNLQIQAK